MKKLMHQLFNTNQPIRKLMFNIITCTVLVMEIPAFIIMFIGQYGKKQLPAMCGLFIITLFCVFLANKYEKLNLSAGIIVFAVTCGVFPIMFFTGGAVYSGMPIYFAVGIVFVYMLLDGPLFWVILIIQLIIYLLVFLAAFGHPNLVTSLGAIKDVYADVFLSILICGTVLGIINKLNRHSYERMLKKIEEQNIALKESEMRAEQANMAKSDFLSSMSHEIRTPINAVIGMNEMIKRESRNKDILEYSDAIGKSAEALLSIINDVLDFSKIESGKMNIVNNKYDLFSLINDSYCMIKERAADKGLRFEVECDEHLPAYLTGDIIRIRQIIVNLLTNAVKYTEKGSASLKVSGEKTSDGYLLKIVVEDTGIGMSKEELDRLFVKFERVNLEHNQGIEGTGLGLTIVKQLVSLMNGSVEVESEPGKGSAFTVILPQGVESDYTEIGKAKFGIGVNNKEVDKYVPKVVSEDARILAVDDVQMNLFVFKKLIKDTKIQVDTATSGTECLEMIKNTKYNIIFMDHMMPNMDGIETFKIIRSTTDHMNVDTPIIMLTANAIAGMEEKYLEIGFSDYLSKPIDVNKLEELIRKHLNPDENNKTEEDIGMECNVDVQAGINNCGGAKDFYLEILDEFIAEGKIEELKKCYEDKDWELYTIDVHSIKGTLRLIGANDAGEVAEKLQFAGEAKDIATIDSMHNTLLDMIDISLEKIRAAV